MKTPHDMLYTEELLQEAMELLADNLSNMGIFHRQRYGKLKRRIDQHVSLSKDLKDALNEIDTNF